MEKVDETMSTIHKYNDTEEWHFRNLTSDGNMTRGFVNNSQNSTTEKYEVFGNNTIPDWYWTKWWYFMMGFTLEYRIPVTIILSIISLVTVAGNIFVISAIKLDNNLRKKSNILIASLAVTDLMVGIFVVPVDMIALCRYIHYSGRLRYAFRSTTVFLTYASVCHLVAIALDRYWAVTNFKYMVDRSLKRIISMIVISWSVSAIPVGLRYDFSISISISYYYTFGITFLCQVIVVAIYIKIYQVARKNIRDRLARRHNSMSDEENERREREKENKATRTVAIITGAFIVCWCPFPVYDLIWRKKYILLHNSFGFNTSELLRDIFRWISYCNSTINPVIYTVFNPDFRAAFIRMMCRQNSQHGTVE